MGFKISVKEGAKIAVLVLATGTYAVGTFHGYVSTKHDYDPMIDKGTYVVVEQVNDMKRVMGILAKDKLWILMDNGRMLQHGA